MGRGERACSTCRGQQPGRPCEPKACWLPTLHRRPASRAARDPMTCCMTRASDRTPNMRDLSLHTHEARSAVCDQRLNQNSLLGSYKGIVWYSACKWVVYENPIWAPRPSIHSLATQAQGVDCSIRYE